jgi:ser/thr/tyr protein kinase RAD53
MAAQICQAVAYTHEQGIIHGDLKLENIILTDTIPPTYKITNFDLSKVVNDAASFKVLCGTPAYLAPEVISRVGLQADLYTDKISSYSLGVTLFYL